MQKVVPTLKNAVVIPQAWNILDMQLDKSNLVCLKIHSEEAMLQVNKKIKKKLVPCKYNVIHYFNQKKKVRKQRSLMLYKY